MTGGDPEGMRAIALLLMLWLGLRLLTRGWFSGGAAGSSPFRVVLGRFVMGMLSFAVVCGLVFDGYARGLWGPRCDGGFGFGFGHDRGHSLSASN